MNTTDKQIKLEELLQSKGWEILYDMMKKQRAKIAQRILYGDLQDTPDANLTLGDLAREQIKTLNWVMEKAIKNMIENPNYVPEENPEDLTKEEWEQVTWEALDESMFKQSV